MSSASYRYAKSLIDLAVESNVLDDVYSLFEKFYDTVCLDKDLENVLKDETFTKKEKKDVLKNLFDDSDEVLFKNFLYLLADKNRIGEIKHIYLEFKRLYFEEKNILNVEVVSSNKLSKKIKEKLQSKLEDKFKNKIILNEKIDKDLIGGIVLYINGKMIDLSVKNELNNIKRQLKDTKIV